MRETEKFVFFWQTADIYSNWYPARFRINGHTFANSEQAMMYEKAKLMGDESSMAKILKTTNPKAVKALGRDVKLWKEDLWKKHRLEIMTNFNINIIEKLHTYQIFMLKFLIIQCYNLILFNISQNEKNNSLSPRTQTYQIRAIRSSKSNFRINK